MQNRGTQALLPLTVNQISEALQESDDKANFLIDGVDVNNVKLVGMLFEKTERVHDDGTGRMDCHRWVNEAVDTKEMELPSRVTDYDEIAKHFADCMYVNCYNTKARKMQGGSQVTGHIPNSAFNTPSKGGQRIPSNHLSVQYDTDGIKGIDKFVLNYLQQPSYIIHEKGVHHAELAQQLNVPDSKILEAIEALEAEGLV